MKNIIDFINQVILENNGVAMKQNIVDAHYVTKSDNDKEKCSNCGWFKGNGVCGIVDIDVVPNGWCRLWGTKKFCGE